MECESKGCTKSGDTYTVLWREHGMVLCPDHARKNRGILSQGKASELIVI